MAEAVGVRLKALREYFGWSQRELAKRAGVPNSAISVIEQGSVSPSVLSLQKVLKGFSLTLHQFFSIDTGSSLGAPSAAILGDANGGACNSVAQSNVGVTLYNGTLVSRQRAAFRRLGGFWCSPLEPQISSLLALTIHLLLDRA